MSLGKISPDFMLGAFKKLKKENKAYVNAKGILIYNPTELLTTMQELRDEYLFIVEGER